MRNGRRVEPRTFFLPPIGSQPTHTIAHFWVSSTNIMDPSTMPAHRMSFSVVGSSAPILAPRVGKLAIASRNAISTPHYIPLTSKGTVPHITHDLVQKETAINSLYVGLEDCTFPVISGPQALDFSFKLTPGTPAWA